MPHLKIGDAAPDVTFIGPNNEQVPLSFFIGRENVVLAFYPAAFTGGCEAELRFFQSKLADFQRLNAQVIGSSTDPPDMQVGFASHCGLKFPLLADTQKQEAARAFGVYNEGYQSNDRVTFVIDRSGLIRHVTADEDDMHRHATDSLEALKKL